MAGLGTDLVGVLGDDDHEEENADEEKYSGMNSSAHHDGDDDEDVLRIDPRDNVALTKAEFIERYGGADKWEGFDICFSNAPHTANDEEKSANPSDNPSANPEGIRRRHRSGKAKKGRKEKREEQEQQTEEEDAAVVCWICYTNDDPEDFVSPCACKGSISKVHKRCLRRWFQTSSGDGSSSNAERRRCPQCQTIYDFTDVIPQAGSVDAPSFRELLDQQLDSASRVRLLTELGLPLLYALLFLVLLSITLYRVVSCAIDVQQGKSGGRLELTTLAPLHVWLDDVYAFLGLGHHDTTQGLERWWQANGVTSRWSQVYRQLSYQMLWGLIPTVVSMASTGDLHVVEEPEDRPVVFLFFREMAHGLSGRRRLVMLYFANFPLQLIIIHRLRDAVVSCLLPVLRPVPVLHDSVFKFIMTFASSYVFVGLAILSYICATVAMCDLARAQFRMVHANLLLMYGLEH